MQRGLVALALALLAACLWALTHRFRDLLGDAELYAVQALARLHPQLATDIYLRNVSQDRYTLFSPLYAQLIAWFGLHAAERGLFIACTAWFYAASFALARRLSNAALAWASVALLMVMVGRYGSYGVFRYAEEFLTARSLAEALVVTSLACFYAGWRGLALGIAAATLFIHPLMALPGLLLVLCLLTGLRIALAGALAGVALAAILATAAVHAPQVSGYLALIDGDWLDVVRERSQFLFLQLWRFVDWKANALPFASLALTLLAVRDARMRQLAWAAMLVGAAGLAVAWIASVIGPVAILIQGQAWRWVWIPSFVSILLLAPTLAAMWEDERGGRLCAVVLLGGWSCAAVETWNCIGLAAGLWLMRPLVTGEIARLLRAAALVLVVVLACWTVASVWTLAGAPPAEVGRDPAAIALARNALGLQTLALGLCGAVYWLIATRRGPWAPAAGCVALATLAAATLPSALTQFATAGSDAEYAAFADWRAAIPSGSNVAVIGVHNATAFVWFTLDRPNYLSIDQSSGVVFSRATALEARRRSVVLEPLVEPSWKIMTFLAKRAGQGKVPDAPYRPLTAPVLTGMCRDGQLGFVIARESVGFGGLRHIGRGPFSNWTLYDCRRVRQAGATA